MPLHKLAVILIFYFTLSLSSCTTGKYGIVTINSNAQDSSANQINQILSLSKNHFGEGYFKGNQTNSIFYRYFSPSQSLNHSKKYPLIVVFHGSGAIGTNNESQLGILAKLFASSQIQKEFPAFVLAPQFSERSSSYTMDKDRNVLSSSPQKSLYTALELIDSLRSIWNVDPNSIYVVGFSMGGSTVINSLILRPDLFAAGISISGIPQFVEVSLLPHIPIWLIHGTADHENPIQSDELFYHEYHQDHKILFWKLEDAGHEDVFSSQILGATLPKWLFRHSKFNH